MKAIKCDRCGAFQELHQCTTLAGSIIRNTLLPGWCPDSLDLCDKCAEELKRILQEFWNRGEKE